MPTVAEELLSALTEAGARDVFGIPGDAINHLIDALRRQDELRFVHVRNEETGAFAAGMQAKLTGKLGVCFGTAGPGAMHLVNGLADASLDGAPVLAITGQVARDQIGMGQHQEVDLEGVFRSIASYSQTITSAAQAPAAIRQAIQRAMQGRGVAHLAIPTDLVGADVPKGAHRPSLVLRSPRTVPHEDDLDRAAELLRGAGAVTILAGRGAACARDQVVELARKLDAPIVRSLRALDTYTDDTPHVVGGLGLLGDRGGVQAMESADLLLLVGTDFPYRDFYPEGVPAIVIDDAGDTIGRRHEAEVAIVSQAHTAVTGLLDRIGTDVGERDPDHLEKARKAQTAWRKVIDAPEHDDALPIKPQRLAATIGEHATGDAIFALDTGAVTAWGARHLGVRFGQRVELSGQLASMGFGLPAAIGAQLAYPERQVVALVGDGSMTMSPGDLLTAAALDLPITIVVFNDGRLSLIALEQAAEGLPEHATTVPGPDFARLAEVMGCEGVRVEHTRDLDEAIAKALVSPRPTVVDVVVDDNQLIIPPKVGLDQAVGFATAKAKELLGRGDTDAGLES